MIKHLRLLSCIQGWSIKDLETGRNVGPFFFFLARLWLAAQWKKQELWPTWVFWIGRLSECFGPLWLKKKQKRVQKKKKKKKDPSWSRELVNVTFSLYNSCWSEALIKITDASHRKGGVKLLKCSRSTLLTCYSSLCLSPEAGRMSVSVSTADGVTVFTLTSDPKSPWPPLCQILKGLCYNPTCCSVSQQLKTVQRTSQSVLGVRDGVE